MNITTGRRRLGLVSVTAAAALVLAACGGTDDGGNGDATGGSTDGSTGGSSGESVTLNLATMAIETTPNGKVSQWFFDELESRSDGRLTVDVTPPESICKGPEIAECVRDGRADLGVSIPDYTPQLFPTTSIVTVPFLAENQQAVMKALWDVNTSNADAQAVWDNNGIELVGAWPVGRLVMGSKDEVRNINDFGATRWRVTGPYLQRAFQDVGANVVALPAAETYEGVERGVADAVAWTLDGAVDYKLMEQLPYWTDPGVGHYTTFSMWINPDVYADLPDDLRAIFDEVREEFNNGQGMAQYGDAAAGQCTTMFDSDRIEQFTRWDDAATAEWSDAIGDSLQAEWVTAAEEQGLANAQSYLDEYLAALESSGDDTVDPVIACVDQFQDR